MTTETLPFKTMYPGYFQTAYVTNDLERAKQALGEAYGIRKWLTNPDYTFPALPGQMVKIDVALAYVGETQFEIIQPKAGAIDFYNVMLPPGDGFALKFHHLCKAFDTAEQYDATLAALQQKNIPMPVNTTREMGTGILACYADFRPQIGHFIEYIFLSEAAVNWMSTIPRN